MSDRQKKSRDARLVDTSYRAEGMRTFISHVEVQGFFADYEARQVDEIVTRSPDDNEGRRDAALRLAAMRELKSAMEAIVSSGDRATRKLELLNNEH